MGQNLPHGKIDSRFARTHHRGQKIVSFQMRFSSFNYFGPFHLLAVFSFRVFVFQLIRPKMADDITRSVNTEFFKLDVEWLFHSMSVIEGSAKR